MKFTVVIPTRNRPQSLARCLESMAQLEYPEEEWELIVVNDGGEQSFSGVTAELERSLPLRLLSMEHSGPAAARNEGAKRARGRYLAFTDDDCQVSPVWLNAFDKGFEESGCDALGGQTRSPFAGKAAERAWQHLFDFLYNFFQDEEGNALLLVSNNAAYRRAAFEHIGGFDPAFPYAASEDLEISYRLLRHDYSQKYYPQARVWHYHYLTPWGHMSQQFRYGRGGYFFAQAANKSPDESLRALYYRPNFLKELRQSLRINRLPLYPTALLFAGQFAYKVGLRYQAMRV